MLISVRVLCLLFSCGFLSPLGEDSWQHYKNGGMFVTTSPSLSADGQYLVYASACTGHGDIYAMKSGSNDPIRLTTSDDFESSPMLTPDGKRIVFVREHEGFRHLWIMETDGSHTTQLTQGKVLDDPQQLSRDGRYLLFMRGISAGGLGKVSRAYLMRVDDATKEPVNVGDTAVVSPDSRFAIYSDAGELWRLDLDGKERQRRRIYGNGWPIDTSGDGKTILTLRPHAEKEWTGDSEIWRLDLDRKSEKQLGVGSSAVLVGANREDVLFFAGTDLVPFLTGLDGGAPKRIECPSTYKTYPKVSLDGRSAVVGSYARASGPDYSVIFIDLKDLRATTIASFTCDGSKFQNPFKDKGGGQ